MVPARVEGEAEDLLVLVAGDATTHVPAAKPRRTATSPSARFAFTRRPGICGSSWPGATPTGTKSLPITDLVVESPERHLGEQLAGDEAFRPMWVTDFPMFELDEESQRWLPAHHPFTSPHEEDMERLVSDPASVRARYYDLAMNGLELGSGSIRIHRQDVQQEIFRALGMSEEEARSRFGFFLEALTYGTPPHGGIALGLDRIAMILAGAQSLREVIAFPKTAKAIDLMVDAPTPVSRTATEGIAHPHHLSVKADHAERA